ncbi:hypothetical protein CK203_020191 [Vitis vinifera]|uniref:Uncharacterized protein n=1 Tax=Vitis vinifera TaxID=29760 RepID=A0A438J847_VITVI|nr:hypothetical protein CK203_020191 [Vitis vinifera]
MASSREEEEDASSANEKVKSAPGLLEFQLSKLAEKKVCTFKEAVVNLLSPKLRHRQGIRSNSEPISRGKIKVDSEEDPKTDDLGAKSQANSRIKCKPSLFSVFSKASQGNLGETDSSPRKKKANLNIFSSNEDMEGFWAEWGLILVAQQPWLSLLRQKPEVKGLA